jgi:poly-gamma-glutamate capsule biosynthesis protein CapA/YwtB (metallophosphatase superfamily)
LSAEVLLGFVGDLRVDRDDNRDVFARVAEILRTPDIVFGNLECAYTDDPRPLSGAPAVISSPARNLDAYFGQGFSVMSLANNHILDVGAEAMLETRRRLRANGIRTCGVGESLADARAPVIIERNGVRIAFLAYASVFPVGHEAGTDRPGLVPVRAYSYWREPYAAYHAPGMLPMVATVPDQSDLAGLAEDIERARQCADVVVTSFHWGDQTSPFHLTDHETRTARYCIDHGAHLVVGHHHHEIRGMEWYKGRPILYGLGHFVFDLRWEWSAEAARSFSESQIGRHYRRIQYAAGPQQDWPLLPFPEASRMTLVAWAAARKQGISAIGFLPCMLRPDGSVQPFACDSSEGQEVVDYFRRCNETQGLNGRAVASSVTLGGLQTLAVVPSIRADWQ